MPWLRVVTGSVTGKSRMVTGVTGVTGITRTCARNTHKPLSRPRILAHVNLIPVTPVTQVTPRLLPVVNAVTARNSEDSAK